MTSRVDVPALVLVSVTFCPLASRVVDPRRISRGAIREILPEQAKRIIPDFATSDTSEAAVQLFTTLTPPAMCAAL
jgi:hypothetical protein